MTSSTVEMSLLGSPEPPSFSTPSTRQKPDRSTTYGDLWGYLRRVRWDILAALLVTTGISTTLVVFTSIEKTFKGSMPDKIMANRAVAQFFVQIFSQILGGFHIYVLTTLFNVVTSQKLQKSPPTFAVFLAIGFCYQIITTVLASAPGALWAGALTPEGTTDTANEVLTIPHYSSDPQAQYWNQTISVEPHPITRTSFGSFSYSPVLAILGSILDTAAVATSPENTTQIFRKLDNTGYSYFNRSYGVGASVGLSKALGTHGLETNTGLKSYEFTEWGYIVNMLILVASLWEAIRNRARVRATRFDYSDLNNLVLGAGRLGDNETRYVDKLQPVEGDPWVKDPEGKRLGDVEMRVERSSYPKEERETETNSL